MGPCFVCIIDYIGDIVLSTTCFLPFLVIFLMYKFLLITIFLFAQLVPASSAIRITDDRGGLLGKYIDKYAAIKKSDKKVVIDGLCASACTLVLGLIKHNNICVSPRASLGFHVASDPAPGSSPSAILKGKAVMIPNKLATNFMFYIYPPNVRRWITEHGGLRQEMIFLGGSDLKRMYKGC